MSNPSNGASRQRRRLPLPDKLPRHTVSAARRTRWWQPPSSTMPGSRPEGGGGLTRIMTDGELFEKAGVAFSRVNGTTLPPSASAHRPELAGRSLGGHGRVPGAAPAQPLCAHHPCQHPLLPCRQGRRSARLVVRWRLRPDPLLRLRGRLRALAPEQPGTPSPPSVATLHDRFKTWCDDYFYLKHRDEARGIGGLFFDDFSGDNFEHAFGMMQSVGNHFFPAYAPYCAEAVAPCTTPSARRDFQLYRRGRYVEFNLVYDQRHPVRPAVRWTHRVHPDVPAAPCQLALQLPAGTGQPRSRADQPLPAHARDWLAS